MTTFREFTEMRADGALIMLALVGVAVGGLALALAFVIGGRL